MKITLLVSLLLTACVDQPQGTAIDGCGESPPYPGAPVSFEQVNGVDKAILDRASWVTLDAWHHDVSAWTACIESL